jgi:signal peptidase I
LKKNNNADHPVLFKIIMLAGGLITGFITVKIFFLLMTVNTDSMLPALKTGDKIVISRMAGIKKGDIIAYENPAEEGKLLLSRILASEYDTVEIRNKTVFVNDKSIDPIPGVSRNDKINYPMKFCFRDNMPPVKLERNEFFVLGDNFDRSFDSRFLGKITKSSIAGKVIYKR